MKRLLLILAIVLLSCSEEEPLDKILDEIIDDPISIDGLWKGDALTSFLKVSFTFKIKQFGDSLVVIENLVYTEPKDGIGDTYEHHWLFSKGTINGDTIYLDFYNKWFEGLVTSDSTINTLYFRSNKFEAEVIFYKQ